MVIFVLLAFMALPLNVLAMTEGTQQPELPTVKQLSAPKDDVITGETSKIEPVELKQLTSERKVEIQSNCGDIQSKIGQINDRVLNLKDQRTNVFENITRVLSNFVVRLENNGVDVGQLKTDVEQLNIQVTETKTAWDTYQTALQNTVSKKCSEDPTGFHDSLEASKLALNDVKTKMLAVKVFINSDIKDDLIQIREQLKIQTQKND